jgi:inosose dehydratase
LRGTPTLLYNIINSKILSRVGGGINVLLGSGIAKIPEMMQQFHRQDFHGLVAVEYEKEGDVNRDMAHKVTFARKLA